MTGTRCDLACVLTLAGGVHRTLPAGTRMILGGMSIRNRVAPNVPEEQRQATLKRIPLGRFGEPEDIANAVLFFSSPLSDFVTGQAINVSGGMQIP